VGLLSGGGSNTWTKEVNLSNYFARKQEDKRNRRTKGKAESQGLNKNVNLYSDFLGIF
jgi:hypothetical protein